MAPRPALSNGILSGQEKLLSTCFSHPAHGGHEPFFESENKVKWLKPSAFQPPPFNEYFVIVRMLNRQGSIWVKLGKPPARKNEDKIEIKPIEGRGNPKKNIADPLARTLLLQAITSVALFFFLPLEFRPPSSSVYPSPEKASDMGRLEHWILKERERGGGFGG